MSIVDEIIWQPLEPDQYYGQMFPKATVFLHHTAGNSDPMGVLRWWNETEVRVGTAFVIGGKPRSNSGWVDGDVVQAFSSKHWAWHLGLKMSHLPPGSASSKVLNAQAIGIEICNWGHLTLRNGKFYTYVNSVVPADEVVTLSTPYRGYTHWHKYTDAQIESCRQLLHYLCETYNIPKGYKGDEMFDIDFRALQGEAGIWTHTSVRPDKTDCYPDPRLVQMLKELDD